MREIDILNAATINLKRRSNPGLGYFGYGSDPSAPIEPGCNIDRKGCLWSFDVSLDENYAVGRVKGIDLWERFDQAGTPSINIGQRCIARGSGLVPIFEKMLRERNARSVAEDVEADSKHSRGGRRWVNVPSGNEEIKLEVSATFNDEARTWTSCDWHLTLVKR